MRYQQDLSFQIKHRTRQELDLVEFMTLFRTAAYTEFFPWLYITTWAISSRISIEPNNDGFKTLRFLGITNETVYLDEHPSEEGEAIALYMGVLHVQEEPVLSGALAASPKDEILPAHFGASSIEEHYQVVFLLVREVESESFRRIGLWTVRIDCDPAGSEEALGEVLILKGKSHDTWGRRTMRLV